MKLRELAFICLLITPVFLHAQEELSLENCRRMALEHNKKVKIANEHELAVQSVKKSAKTQFYPNIQFNGGYLRSNKDLQLFSEDMFLPVVPHEVYEEGFSVLEGNPELVEETFVTNDFQGNPVPVEDPKTGNPLFQEYAYLPKDEAVIDMHNVFFGSIGLVQPIYMGGKVKETVNMAQHGEDMFRAKKDVSISEVIVETDERYWQVISLKEKVKMAEEYKKRLDTLMRDVQNLQEEGIITSNKVMNVKVKRNQVDLQLLKAKNGLKLAQMALNQTIGLPLDTIVELSDSFDEMNELENPEEYLSAALNQRPEIEALNSGVQLAESGERLMKSRFLPNIGLTAGYSMVNPNPYNGFESEFGGDINIGVMVNIPIFNWGEKKHTLNAVRHEKQASIEKLEETKELISMDVQKAIFEYKEASERVEMTDNSLEQAEENLEVTRDNFEEGMNKLADVLEAQSMWQEAYADYIEAKTDLHLQKTKLLKASGKLDSLIDNMKE